MSEAADRHYYISPSEATHLRVIEDFDGWAIDAADGNGGCTAEIWTHYDGELLTRETAIFRAAEFAAEIGRLDLVETLKIDTNEGNKCDEAV